MFLVHNKVKEQFKIKHATILPGAAHCLSGAGKQQALGYDPKWCASRSRWSGLSQQAHPISLFTLTHKFARTYIVTVPTDL